MKKKSRLSMKKKSRLSQTVGEDRRKRTRRTNEKEEVRDPMLDLPADIIVDIFSKLNLVDILFHAQFVSKSWMQIAKDPRIFRTIQLPCHNPAAAKMKQQLTDEKRIKLLEVAVKRSRKQAAKISMASCNAELANGLVQACKYSRLSELEELEFTDTVTDFLCCTFVSKIGKYCPQLKYFRVSGKHPSKEGQISCYGDRLVNAIAENMTSLRGLRLYLATLTNATLKAILEGCTHLHELDLQDCCFGRDIKPQSDLVKECRHRIKDLTLPSGSVKLRALSTGC